MNTQRLSKKLWLLPALLVVSLYGCATDRVIEKTFEVNKEESLRLATDLGSISVESHSDDTVEVKVIIEGLDEDDFSVEMNYRDDEVVILGSRDRNNFHWTSRRVHFNVRVPERFDIDLSTSGGSIKVKDLQGMVNANTSGGSLSFGGIKGDLEARTSGGSISVESVEGDVNISTSGGSIRVGNIEGNLKGRTSGGSIRMESVSGKADVSTTGGSIKVNAVGESLAAKTSGGSITAVFPEQPSADCKLSTSAGSVTAILVEDIEVYVDARGSNVRSDFSVEVAHKTRRQLEGTINGGGPQLELRTSAGSVNIVKG